MPNDVLMFRDSGMSIAMGNANVEVQKQAQLVTASCNDEDFANAVECFVLDVRTMPAGKSRVPIQTCQ